ncbi:MAG: hypothetical protein AABX02_05295, partial [archaeon]
GTAQQNVTISNEECTTLMNPSNSVVWEIQFPNPSKKGPLMELSVNRMVLYPKVMEDIVPATYLALKSMYPDAEAIIGATNSTIGGQQTPEEIADSNAIPEPSSDDNSLGTISV